MAGGKFYINTAIDYSNGSPHLGHALEKIEADCIARYRRLVGDDVRFVIGMDEHGQKVAQAADDAGIPRQDWVNRIAAEFQEAWRRLHISHDDFLRTTQVRHHEAVQALLVRIKERQPDDIFMGTYEGHYCVGCEAFKLDRDLEDGKCPAHPTLAIRWVEEENHFFRLSALAARLLAHYDAQPEFVTPPAKMNEVRNIVADGLQDLSISRSRLDWGIPFPQEQGHTVYVWFDALINYLSATGFPADDFTDQWPTDLNVVGPDIIRFHAVIWPAMLLAAGLPLPRQVWAHGWLNTRGGRFSKSAGVKLTLEEAMSRHGPDALRFFLLLVVPWDGDGDFSWELFDSTYNAFLANNIGNLTSRTTAMIGRYLDGRVPETAPETALDREHAEICHRYRAAMDRLHLNEGAKVLQQLGDAANRFVDERAPWRAAKEGQTSEVAETLAAVHRAIVRIAALAHPFMPERATAMYEQVGGSGDPAASGWVTAITAQTGGWKVPGGPPLFAKLAKL